MKKILNATIDEELWNALKERAESENRTVSNLVETLLLQALNDKKQ